ncbi:centrosomal protein POC5 isoform X3 [Neoarius graeffei]|uniref:centrosomal protein POC5 isoform X3 n=1 Tax=Neoarius graeffei TaxID=443677 RepID=UPI00298CAD67|nr:centrosomal protein POC5 isoform X3 [Neoarius graeffei]
MSQMSSDEEELTSPHLPQDSDRGSSVSSELQEEYEELLRFAVVTPKYDPSVPSQLIHSSSSLKPAQNSSAMDSARSEAVEDVRGNGRRSSPVREVISATCPQQLEGSRPQSQVSEGEEVASRSDRGSEGTHSDSDRSGKSSPDHVINVMMEMFVSEENLNKMEDILDTWSNNLKSNVMMELRRWKIAFVEQHRLEMTKEREKHAAHVAGINAEMDSLKDLLNTYQISNQRKDEVIVNLTRAVDRQRERVELMRSFTQWRLQHSAVKEEAQASKLAEQHYQLQLKKKVWAAWHSLIQRGWRERAERACRARAEEVCLQLSADYEAKLAEHAEALQKAQAEIQRLHRERERYEDSMKKAFMRGVCALNIEALSMFHTADTGRQEQDAPPSGDEPSSSSVASRPIFTASSARLSPVSMETPVQPVHSRANTEDMEADQCSSQPSYSAAVSRTDAPPSTTVVNTALAPGGVTSSLRQQFPQTSVRTVTAGQQKASKTVTARITGRSELGKTGRNPGNLHVMGVAPPMSSIIVERHHPVTQVTVGQATAAKFPRSALQSHAVSSTKSSSQPRGQPSSAFHIHSIKVVD